MIDFHDFCNDLVRRAANFTPSPERRATLLSLSEYIKLKIKTDLPVRLNFICTHNSRRSHFGQAIAQALAAHLNIDNIQTFSGGTEATAFHPNAVKALIDLGLSIEKLSDAANPYYRITTDSVSSEAFSKVFSEIPNLKTNFAAIMVCSSADAGCPVVPGAEKRISLPYEDPKIADGTPEQDTVYRQRALEIGTELAWVFLESKKA